MGYFLASSSPSQSSTLWPSANVIFRMNAKFDESLA